MRFLKPILIGTAAIGLSFPLVSMIDRKSAAPTAYEAELSRIQKDLADLKDASAAPPDAEKTTRRVHRIYQRALLTGDYADLYAAQAAIDHAIGAVGPLADLYLLKANLDFRLHRLEKTERDVEALQRFAGNSQIVALRAGVAFQQGAYAEAKKGYQKAIEKNPSWDNLARLAYWEAKFGDPEIADGIYAQAENEISAKEMRSYAWVELERGLLEFNRGRYDKASMRYRQADKAYSGYWLVEERIAELYGAERKFDQAIALYRKVIAKAPRPEFHQALGDLYRFMGKESEARQWHDAALAAYLESAGRGEVHYYHNLVGFYADVRQDGAEAVKWARRDAELRPNFLTQDGLAWALYRDGQFAAARATVEKTLSSGVKDPHLFFHAGMIYLADGRAGEGKQFLQKVAAINPGYENFHVHR